MEIRHARTEEDLCGKAFVHYNAWNEAYTGLVDQTFLDERTYEQSLGRAHRALDNGYTTYIAVEDGCVIGFTDFGAYRGDDLAEAGEVYAIYVLKEHYGRGAGYALMKTALSLMPEKKRFAVWVLKGNERAIRFY
ncbi:MAG: GNAT family N-acetyltransferase, partial [Ruminiclostridium sp.]|nr:GNAT family N-acetyltransferase [Ruminiclostridium sp.]